MIRSKVNHQNKKTINLFLDTKGFAEKQSTNPEQMRKTNKFRIAETPKKSPKNPRLLKFFKNAK